MVAVVHVEQQRCQGQPWRRWKKMTHSSLPRLDWTDGGVEKVEKITAGLLMDWATRFRGGEHARRRRRTVGNGGRLWTQRCVRRRRERGNGAVSAFGQELALFWSTDMRRGDLGST